MTAPVPTDAEIARWGELAEAATPGPWVLSEPQGNWIWPHICNTYGSTRTDAEFIAESRQAVPRLLALVAHLRADALVRQAEVERLKDDRAEWRARTVDAETELAELKATDDYQRWATAVVERDAAREQVRRLSVTLRDFADHGLRADLMPTTPGGPESIPHLYRYLARLDSGVRERASAALDGEAAT